MTQAKAYAAASATSGLRATTIDRREPGANDVEIAIDFCGLCHSDVHTIRSEWGQAKYPLVPGHEIVGKVSRVGKDVTYFAVGDTVGVGCMVDSCRECDSCLEGFEAVLQQRQYRHIRGSGPPPRRRHHPGRILLLDCG